MKSYRFRLRSVSRVREIQERVARERLMVSVRDLRRSEERERRAESELEEFEPPPGPVTMSRLVWAGDQAERLAETLRARRKVRLEALVAWGQACATWNAAEKRAHVLHRLEESGLQAWRDEVERHARAELDDWANTRRRLTGETT